MCSGLLLDYNEKGCSLNAFCWLEVFGISIGSSGWETDKLPPIKIFYRSTEGRS